MGFLYITGIGFVVCITNTVCSLYYQHHTLAPTSVQPTSDIRERANRHHQLLAERSMIRVMKEKRYVNCVRFGGSQTLMRHFIYFMTRGNPWQGWVQPDPREDFCLE